MRRIQKTRLSLAIAGGLLLASGLPAGKAGDRSLPVWLTGANTVQAAGNNTRRTASMRQNIYQRFSRIREMADEGSITQARTAIQDMQNKMDLNGYEQAMLWNLSAWLHYEQKDYDQAAADYQRLLEQPELPLSLQQDTLYSLTKLHMVLEQYDAALESLEQWMAMLDDPGPEAWLMKGQILYQNQSYQESLTALDEAIREQRSVGKKVPENWYLLQRAGYYQLEDYQGLGSVLETLVSEYPSPEYLVQLASVYGQLDKSDQQLAMLEAAYEKGYLETESRVMNLAQLLLAADNPYKAARVISEGLDTDIVKATTANLSQLGDSWLLAREHRKALDALGKAAAASEDGETHFRMAQIAVDRGWWSEAEDYATEAVRRGGFDQIGSAHLVRGLARFNQDQLADALASFALAKQYEGSRAAADQWQAYVRAEQERRAKLKAAVAGEGGSAASS
jgi:tetratricopeptide (TPR) repeat protein